MGIFDNVFGGKKEPKEEKSLPWKQLTEMSQLDDVVTASKGKTVAILKHSTTCGISRMVLRQLEREYDYPAEQVDFYYLDLKAYRSISNEIAQRFNVWHESPQLIVIRNGEAVYNASHSAIVASAIEQFV